MNEDELKAIDQRLAAMSERCDAVIAKERPVGKRMPILDFKPRSRKPQYQPLSDMPEEGVAERFDNPSPAWRHPTLGQPEDCIEQIFADFERQFDEMAQAHRQRA